MIEIFLNPITVHDTYLLLEVIRIALEECLEKLRKINLVSCNHGDLVQIVTGRVAGLLLPMCWGFLDTRHEKAYVQNKGYLRRYIENHRYLLEQLKTYDSMAEILTEEGFTLLYYTDVKEL